MTPDLVAACNAALDETERLARDSVGDGDGHWRLADYEDGTTTAWYGEVEVMTSLNRADAEHIAFHDPAAVLRRVAAQRRVFERHRPCVGDDGQATCEHCPADYEDELTPWPCPEIADLADGLGIDLEEET